MDHYMELDMQLNAIGGQRTRGARIAKRAAGTFKFRAVKQNEFYIVLEQFTRK
jgi:hypothetical protein